MVDDITRKRFEKKLSPEIIKRNLKNASLFLSAYELLKSLIIEKLKGHYLAGSKNGKLYYMEEYEIGVKRRAKSILEASCMWLVDKKVITEEDANDIQSIREHRNLIAHRLPDYLFDPDTEVDMKLLGKARQCLDKIGRHWMSIAIDSDPQFDNVELNYDEIKPSTTLAMDLIIESAGDTNQ